jgi:CHAT domain-containing protein/tetratricopeptide (TPR) repeat protein
MGEYGKALPLFEQARAIFEKERGANDPVYATSLDNLAALHKDMGDYGKALPLFEQARAIRKKTVGEGHPLYAASLDNLAVLYGETGEYDRALPLSEQAVAIYRKALGEGHLDYAVSLNNLAMLYKAVGTGAKALPLLEQARAIREKALGENHPHYAASLNNLAGMYRDTGDYARAVPLFEKALAIHKKARGENHPYYAHTLNGLAVLYLDTGEYARALPLLRQALSSLEHSVGERHRDYATTLSNLATLHQSTGDYGKAARFAHQALAARTTSADITFAAQNARLRLQLLADSHHFLNRYLSVALPANADPAQIHGHVLAWKGAVAARQAEERLALEHPELAPLLDKLRQARAALAQLSQSPPRDPDLQGDWVRRLRDREADRDTLETELALKSAAFRRTRNLSFGAVGSALPAGAVFVDLVAYLHLRLSKVQKGRYELEPRYLAFVLVKGRDPVVLELGKAHPIDEAVAGWRRNGLESLTPDVNARRLGELVWRPLTKHLGGAKTVYRSPDGTLSQFPFAALPGGTPGSFLLEELTFVHISSGRHLLDLAGESKAPPHAGLLAVGALDFGKPATGADYVWQELPGTQREAERVAALFARTHPAEGTPRLLSGPGIDVERLRREVVLAEGPRLRYLHLATHGFFREPKPTNSRPKPKEGPLTLEEVQRVFTYDRNPLLSSGLVLSGANSDPGKGVLTAEEVMGLDLRGCELCVLSACETGLGKVSGSQGVQGLQLAFHTAGVRTLAASLWQVNDAATSVLMEEFYANLWQKKLSRAEALRQAQLTALKNPDRVKARVAELRELLLKRGISEEVLAARGLKKAVDLPDDGRVESGERRSPPAWWAAFVLSGDPSRSE